MQEVASARVQSAYTAEQAVTSRGIAAALGLRSGDVIPPGSLRKIRPYVERSQKNLAGITHTELNAVLTETRAESISAMRAVVAVYERAESTPLDDPRVQARMASVQTMPGGTPREFLVRATQRIASDIQDVIRRGIVREHTVGETLGNVDAMLEGSWWRIDRIARTESSYAYSSVADEGVKALAKESPDIGKRWVEHVSDTTGAPLDNRVALDSIVMHGQVTTANGVFTMPNDDRVDARMWGMSWDFPPNRPNDRSVLEVFSPRWGVPGWEYVVGKRVPIRLR